MQYSINCSCHAVHCIPIIYLFYNWTFVPFESLHPFPPLPTLHLWQPPVCSLYLSLGFILFYFQMPHMSEIIQYLSFSIWLTSNLAPLSFTHVVISGRISFFNSWIIFLCVCVCVCITFSLSIHLGCLHKLAIVNNAAVSVEVHISSWVSVFVSLDKYPKLELLDHTVFKIFWGNSILFFIEAIPIYIPTYSAQ